MHDLMLHKFSQILTLAFTDIAAPSTVDTADVSKDASTTNFISVIKETVGHFFCSQTT